MPLVDFDIAFTGSDADVQSQFDKFYSVVLNLLDTFFPESSVTITSRDPSYMTAHVKAMLRRKNRLIMRKGRGEETSDLARRIGNEITRHTTQLSLVHENVDSREMWACVICSTNTPICGQNPRIDVDAIF